VQRIQHLAGGKKLAETEAKLATAAPGEKWSLQQRAEVLREWLTPKLKTPLST
jgi:hypothetical protein